MSLESLQSSIKEFNKKLIKHYDECYKDTPNRKVILDGIVNVDHFYKSPKKILWILKEPYCDGNNGGSGWSIVENINTQRSENKKKDSQATWHPIAYASHGILNGFKRFEEMKKKSIPDEVQKSLKKIAFINFQKMPATSKSNDLKIGKAFTDHQEILMEQINLINPDIIICGAGNNAWGRSIKHKSQVNNSEEKFLHQVYHPAKTKLTRAKYVNEIINKCEAWYNAKAS